MIRFLVLTAASPLVGAAGAAVELVERRLSERTLWGSSKKQAEGRHRTRRRHARRATLVESARRH
jgi:hypothetical protein